MLGFKMDDGWLQLVRRNSDYFPITTGRETKHNSSPKPILIKLVPSILMLVAGIVIGMHWPLYLSVYTRRPLTTSSILPPKLPPIPTSLSPPIDTLPPPEQPVPNVVHYVYGLAPEPQPDFPYYAYLAMRSALVMLKPDRVMFHCIHEPKGYWWDRVKGWEGWVDQDGIKKGLLEVVPARNVEWVGKDRHPVVHYAHKADVLRLEALLEYGGVYLDIDTFVLKPFADYSLMQYDTVMAMEANMLSFLHGPLSDDEMRPKGLCNAIIIARKGAEFIRRWMQTYDVFDESQWSVHSVNMPWKLAQLYPQLVTVLSERTFFWPLWTLDHIRAVYASTTYDFDRSGQLAYHAWESKARQYLDVLDPSTINEIDTSFTRLVKRFREPGEEVRWRRCGRPNGAGSGTGLDKGSEDGEREETM